MYLAKSSVAKVAMISPGFEGAPNGSHFCLKRKESADRVETVARIEIFMPLDDVMLASEEHAPFRVVSPIKNGQICVRSVH